MTFAALRYLAHAGAAEFQTAWFVVSLLTELAVLFVLRTRRFALRSRPSGLLLWSAVVMAAVALALPYVPLAREAFGLVALSPILLAATVGITLAYAMATEIAKRFVMRPASRAAASAHSSR
jgi:Mg2+-importing ATPase